MGRRCESLFPWFAAPTAVLALRQELRLHEFTFA